jgi:hypothetical protein
MKRILCFVGGLVLVVCLVSLSQGAVVFEIGDRDGFGFDPAYLLDKVGTTGLAVDTNGNGKLEPGEFLPDVNLDGDIDELPPDQGGDGFDNRGDREKDTTDGAQFTDVSYLADEYPYWIQMSIVSFLFDVGSLEGLPLGKARLRLVYADFEGDCPEPEAVNCDVCNEVYADGQVIGNIPLTNPKEGGIGEATFDVPIDLLADGSVTITFESSDSVEFDVATLRVGLATENVRPLVRLKKIDEQYDSTSVPGGPAGTYSVTYRMRNKSSTPIWAPFLKFKPRTPGILLLNADGGPSGKGAILTPDVGTDVTLAPDEKVTFHVVIGLTAPDVPRFKLKVRGSPLTP